MANARFADVPASVLKEATRALLNWGDICRADPFLMFLKVDPRWKDLRYDPRYIRLLKRMRLHVLNQTP